MARKVQFEDGTVMGWIAETDLDKPSNVRTLYDTEADAIASENAGKYEARIELFVRSHEWARGQEKRARDLVSRFLGFEDSLEDVETAIADMQVALDAEKAARDEARKENMRRAREAREVPPAPGVAQAA